MKHFYLLLSLILVLSQPAFAQFGGSAWDSYKQANTWRKD